MSWDYSHVQELQEPALEWLNMAQSTWVQHDWAYKKKPLAPPVPSEQLCTVNLKTSLLGLSTQNNCHWWSKAFFSHIKLSSMYPTETPTTMDEVSQSFCLLQVSGKSISFQDWKRAEWGPG